MLTDHTHKSGEFDPGHCRTCAREAGLLDHFRRVQREEAALRLASAIAEAADKRATRALWLSATTALIAVLALLLALLGS